jgi:hypothetical protein
MSEDSERIGTTVSDFHGSINVYTEHDLVFMQVEGLHSIPMSVEKARKVSHELNYLCDVVEGEK